MKEKKINSPSYRSLGELIEKIISEESGPIGAEDLSVVKVIEQLLKLAYENNASDIHIEPYEEKTLIRFRIDGFLHDILNVHVNLHGHITTRIKILSRLRTDEHSAPQDGKLRFKVDNEQVDVRVSIVPVVYGEKLVLRILSDKDKKFELQYLGFSAANLELIERSMKSPWGMILSTGPTGSGKTTTLYGILQNLNRREVNISTIEDPVEYAMDNVNQIQIKEKTGLTFATGLRAILRQDPDIIMVGEIRDKDTASIAINSALTGHLVLSTLHTNDAATTLPRFIDMGVPPFLVASTVNIAIAQRLVRKICHNCIEEQMIQPALLDFMKREISDKILKKFNFDSLNKKLFYGKGCETCQMSGYQGRLIIAEILDVTSEIKDMIMQKKNASEIAERAKQNGMVTMLEDGFEKVNKGITTIDEILRVAQE